MSRAARPAMTGLTGALVAALTCLFFATAARASDGTPAGAAGEKAFDLRIERGKIAGGRRVVRVTQGDRVRLRWSADAPTALHLHGYDIERRVAPGETAEMAFEAKITGRFSVSIHGEKDAAKGGHHHAPLIRLEVHPQ